MSSSRHLRCLPDRIARFRLAGVHHLDPPERPFKFERLEIVKNLKIVWGGPLGPAGCVCARAPAEKFSQYGPGRARTLAEGMAYWPTAVEYSQPRSVWTVSQHADAWKS